MFTVTQEDAALRFLDIGAGRFANTPAYVQ